MKTKDFSEVSKLIINNGVGVAKLYFKISLPLGPFCSFLIKGKLKAPWFEKDYKSRAKNVSINFSDGVNYLGTLSIPGISKYITIGGTEKDGSLLYENLHSTSPEFNGNALIFIDKKYGIHKHDLTIDCNTIAPTDNLGTCTILSNGILW
jgi:hypothetical protein